MEHYLGEDDVFFESEAANGTPEGIPYRDIDDVLILNQAV